MSYNEIIWDYVFVEQGKRNQMTPESQENRCSVSLVSTNHLERWIVQPMLFSSSSP